MLPGHPLRAMSYNPCPNLLLKKSFVQGKGRHVEAAILNSLSQGFLIAKKGDNSNVIVFFLSVSAGSNT
jgi:hypothetical protein